MMIFKKLDPAILLFAIFTVLLFWGCESNFKDVQKMDFSEFIPSGEADDFNLKYTDSGKIKSILLSPKMLDYANVDFPFTEFPKGIHVTMYDNKGKKTLIVADYGVTFKGTDIIDLQHNVKISNETGQLLETEQTNGFLLKKSLNLQIRKAFLLDKELISAKILKSSIRSGLTDRLTVKNNLIIPI